MTADRPAIEPRTEAERFGMWATDSPEVFALAKALDAVNGPLPDGEEEDYPSWQRDWADQVRVELRALGFEIRAEAAQGAAPLDSKDFSAPAMSEGAAPRAEGLLSPATETYLAMREKGQRLPSRLELQRQLMECEDALAATERALAAPRAEGLDVERLATAIRTIRHYDNNYNAADEAEQVAAEYAHLSHPSDD